MSDIATQLPEDIKNAMRAKDATALNALRALKSALTNASIEKGSLSTVLDESEAMAVVRKQIKQRLDSIEQFEKAGRAELAATEKAEIEFLSRYLPAALGEAELAGGEGGAGLDGIEAGAVEQGTDGALAGGGHGISGGWVGSRKTADGV